MRSIILLASILLFNVPAIRDTGIPVIKEGVLDLRDISFSGRYSIKLNGEWEFYWNKLYRPHHFLNADIPEPEGFIDVPSYWTDADLPGIKPTGKGYATYRLTILLPEGPLPPLGLNLKVFDSSYDLYVNGLFLGNNGVPGSREETSVPEYNPRIYRFLADTNRVEIVLNVSNFHHRRGGFWLPAEFGTFNQIQSHASVNYGRAISNVSMLVVFCIFFLFFYLLYRKDKVPLFFAIALIGMALRLLVTNQFLIYLFFNPAWDLIIRLEYFSLYITLSGGFLFLWSLYNSAYHLFFARLAVFLFSLLLVATIFLPVTIFSYFTFPVYVMVVVFAINSLTCSIIQLYRSRLVVHAFYFAGFLIIVSAALHDIILALSNVSGHGNYILSEAILIFISIQAGLLIYRWVRSFREEEKLRNRMEQLNRDLESIVESRTRELVKAKNRAESYSKKIERQNISLTETIQLKNKIFAVIAHDLRSPVVNIQYILNLLKEDEFRDKYQSLAGSCIQYSQMVINLLENMMVWGRGQEDQIRYSPDHHDLAGIILTNMSIYKDNADRKNVSVNFTQIGRTIAWVDKDLIDIIIRNLLSNAIKYTNRGGRISILLKEKHDGVDQTIIKICDNGVGIPVEKQSGLFTSKEIESTPGTENEKGTGFGLKLVHELVIVNKGTIEMDSTPGEGTCFTIALPGKKPPED
ncbi:MAG: sensor histidine kinase [Bacteroidales bacterium]|jgi:signal transduction histidine kinase|nr:sensor histidine kinase [Bacteroidales bacterium]